MYHPQLDKMSYKGFSLPRPPHKERIIVAGPLTDRFIQNLLTKYPVRCPLCEQEGQSGKMSLCYDQVHNRYFIKHSSPAQHDVPLCEGATGAETIQKWNTWANPSTDSSSNL